MFLKTNSFHIEGFKYLFYDIFIKNNYIYLICALYDQEIDISNLNLCIDNIQLPVYKIIKRIDYEPAEIIMYHNPSNTKTVTIAVTYNGVEKIFILENNTTVKDYSLTITTLLKDDYSLFPIFYKYYKNQGVEHFYMYYNGIITAEIESVFNFDDVTLIEWDFKYWNILHFRTIYDLQQMFGIEYTSFLENDFYYWRNKYTTVDRFHHLAQMGQLHHSLYKYGKDNSEYMIFCDLDEYLHVPLVSILDTIKKDKNLDVIGFKNHWSATIDGTIPEQLPSVFLYDKTTLQYPIRSKSIYKTSIVDIISPHHGHLFSKIPNITTEFMMFHFAGWSGKKRECYNINTQYRLVPNTI